MSNLALEAVEAFRQTLIRQLEEKEKNLTRTGNYFAAGSMADAIRIVKGSPINLPKQANTSPVLCLD